MAYVTPIGFDPAQIDYWLGQEHGCGSGSGDRRFSYYADDRESPLRWIGRGLADVGITAGSVLTPDQFPMAKALLNGAHPQTGEVLVEPKVAIYEDAKLPLVPLLRAIRGVAAEADVPVSDVLTNPKHLAWFQAGERAVASKGEGARRRADELGQLADAASLDIDQLWGEDAYRTAVANLSEIHVETKPDGTTQEVRRPRRRIVGNGGYGLTLTLPKGLAVLPAFAEAPLAADFEQIYLTEVERTFAWWETATAYGMRGKHGNGRSAKVVQGNGFLGWRMIHRTARPASGAEIGDPHWHVHLTIANMTLGEDGHWSTVASGGRDLIRHAPAADRILQALVRYRLHTQYGIRFAWNNRTKKWEVAGIPDATLRLFSKRNSDIHDTLLALGYEPGQATRAQERIAEQRTRNSKGDYIDTDTATLQEIWQGQELAAGRDPEVHMRRVLNGGRLPDDTEEIEPEPDVTVESIAQALLDPNTGLTAHSRRFSRADALWRVADAMPNGYASPAEIEAMTDRVLAHAGFLRLPDRLDPELAHHTGAKKLLSADHMSNAQSYTTDDVVEAETTILRAAKASHIAQSPVQVTDPNIIELAIGTVEAAQNYELSEEQRRALLGLVTSGRMIDTVEGAPGTGKTTLMRAVRVTLEAAGFVVGGAATAAVAALNLQAESGIHARTIASYTGRIDDNDPEVLAGVDVLVIDEANLTNDRDRAKIYRRAAHTGTRIIEIGDSHQLRGVGVGSLFGHVHELADGAVLRDNRRQADEDEREAIAAWRDARYAEALSTWSGKGRLVATETATEATAAMLSSWWEQRQGAPDPHTEIRGLVMLAATNLTVRRLNDAAQAMRLHEGELGEGRNYDLAGGGTQRLHVGDHILLRTNAYRSPDLSDVPVLNGFRAVVHAIDVDGTITAQWQQHDADGVTTLSARLLPKYVAIGGVELGYAMTVHKSEGLTVKDQWGGPDGDQFGGTVLFAAAGADNPAAHVATSRHATSVWLFGAREELETELDTHVRGVPTTRGERDDRVLEKLAERARNTETSPDDFPVVVQLGLPEFRTEADTHARQADHDERIRRERDAEAARREAQRRRDDRAHQTAEGRRARAERQAEAERLAATAAVLLREVWRHEPALVEQIIAGTAFSAVATSLGDVENSALDVYEVLAEVPLDTIGSDQIIDKTRFTAWAINDAAERIKSGQAASDHDRAARRRDQEQARDQAGDLLREAWPTRPELAEEVISAPAFGAVVRGLERHMAAGFDPRDLLAKVALAKVDSPTIADKARFTAYSLHRIVEHERDKIDREFRAADRAAAERHRRRTAADYLQEAWSARTELADRVIAGPAFGIFAQRVEDALEADVDVPRALASIPPETVDRTGIRNLSAFLVSVFDRAVDQQITERDTTPEPEADVHEVGSTPNWTSRTYGWMTDDALRQAIDDHERDLRTLATRRAEAEDRAAQLRAAAATDTGAHVQALDANLASARALAAAAAETARLRTEWSAARERAQNAAVERGDLEHELQRQGKHARSRRTELIERAEQLRLTEEQAQADGLAHAQRAAALKQQFGQIPDPRRIEARVRAIGEDYPHARIVARHRDADAASVAERQVSRVTEHHARQAELVETLRAEHQLRQHMPSHEHELEHREREQRLHRPLHAEAVRTVVPERGSPSVVNDIEYLPEPQPEIDPPSPGV
ncbi:MAG: MobF family relaxase [Umezawaea sp.]